MSIAVFEPGDRVYFTRTATKAAGQSGTPASVTVVLTVKDAAGALVTPAPTVTSNVVAGVVTSTAALTIPAVNTSAGFWHARWVYSGDIIAVEREYFFVVTSPVLVA